MAAQPSDIPLRAEGEIGRGSGAERSIPCWCLVVLVGASFDAARGLFFFFFFFFGLPVSFLWSFAHGRQLAQVTGAEA